MNQLLVQGEGPIDGINGSFGLLGKIFFYFSKSSSNLCLSLHYNGNNSRLFVTRKEIFSFNADNKDVNFRTQFCLASISNGFGTIESIKVSLKGNVYDFPVDYNATNKSDIFNIHNYLMVEEI